jgi:hypothetical protein
MLPPVLEIYVVWHPDDAAGEEVARSLIDHFHGGVFTGLIAGAVEVYERSQGWASATDAPRPIPLPGSAGEGPARAALTVVVPVVGLGLARAVQKGGPWAAYAEAFVAARGAAPTEVMIAPVYLPGGQAGGRLGDLLYGLQPIGAPAWETGETADALRARDLSQAMAQFASPDQGRITVFISHTRREGEGESGVVDLIRMVRSVIADTRLASFFDAQDLQSGQNWDKALRDGAAHSALLVVRSDLYPTRDWCQREIATAKRAGTPVVILDALGRGEERGSFLMDHCPRLPSRRGDGSWDGEDIRRALDRLVDERLKRVLWARQRDLARGDARLAAAWWAPHAPEPLTFAHYLAGAGALGDRPLSIIHPDPPLGACEQEVLQQMAVLCGVTGGVDILTPRQLASRGG